MVLAAEAADAAGQIIVRTLLPPGEVWGGVVVASLVSSVPAQQLQVHQRRMQRGTPRL